jgi:putative phosphoribosyl transferase
MLAFPVAASTCRELRAEVDEIVCAAAPGPFYASGLWYEDFTQITDGEIRELLARAAQPARRVA